MLARPAPCRGCPLDSNPKTQGFVPPSGDRSAPILLFGEAAGVEEALSGVPFVGQAGGTLNRILARNHQPREAFRIANTIACRPPNNWFDERAPWYRGAFAHCEVWREPVLAEGHPVVVALGGTALKTLLGLHEKGIRVEDFHGTVTRDPSDRFWVVPTFHPSYLARGAMNLFGVASFDLQVALRVAAEGWTPETPDILVDPPLDWATWWVEQVEAVVAQDPLALWLAVDIETPDKAAGQDEGLLTSEDQSYQILRVNFSVHPDEGVTFPYAGPYVALVERLLKLACPKQLWNGEYDGPRLAAAGHSRGGDWWDFMWAWHHLQSDVPRGLGFVAPFYSKFGAWKHLAGSHPGYYAACDGFQTWRVGTGIATDLSAQGMWDNFARHTHALHRDVLKPAQVEGVRISRERLTVFIADLEVKQRRLLHQMQGLVPDACRPLTPKGGLKRAPVEGAVHTKGRATKKDGTAKKDAPDPIKQELYAQVATVVSRDLRTVAYRCHACGADDVSRTHRCPDTKGPNPASLELVEAERTRWFWQEPFNPDSPQQILAYLALKGHKPGKGKTGADSTDRETLERLKKETKDPLYAALIDSRAVIKVKGTYGVGTLKRLDGADRVHPVPTFAPTTHRLCIAAGTPIEVARDVARYPKGIPIEEVRPGMLAYTFDDQRHLRLRPVLWAGQTGVKAILRVHWVAGYGAGLARFGYVDMTPEHEVRLVDGTYRRACDLQQGDRTLALTRGLTAYGYQRLWATGYQQINEHRFIYEELTGEVAEHVHHINHQRLDNRPENLAGQEAGAHLHYHGKLQPTPRQVAARRANMQRLRADQAAGRARPLQPFRLNLTKEWLQQVLTAAGGRPTYVAEHYGIDYTTLLKYIDRYEIKCSRKPRKQPKHNHVVVFVEQRSGTVPVYDLTVEQTHNFIANEVCVHNSYRDPNITNVVADKEGEETLAAGFRRCVVSGQERPAWLTDDQLAAWEAEWH